MQNRERQSVLRKEKSGTVRDTKGSFYQHKSEIPPVGQKSWKVHMTSGKYLLLLRNTGKAVKAARAWTTREHKSHHL